MFLSASPVIYRAWTKKPICIVFSNLGLGGVQTKIIDLVLYITDKYPNVPIHLILRKKSPFDLSKKIRLPHVYIHVFSNSPKEVRRPFLFTVYILYLFLKIHPRSILVFLSPFALPVLLVKKILFWLHIRVVVNEDNLTSGVLNTYSYPLLHKIGIPLFYPFADKIIVPTHAVRYDLLKNFRIPTDKIALVPNWTLLKPNALKRMKKYDVVYIGRLDKTKTPLTLFNILKTVVIKKSDIRCAIFGTGSYETELKRLIQNNSMNRNIFLYPPTAEVASILTESKLLLYYPIRNADGFPVSILEAMAVGIPVVTGYFQGIEDVLIDNDNALICTSKHQAVINILALLRSRSKRNRIAHEGLKTIKANHGVQCIHAYIQELIA